MLKKSPLVLAAAVFFICLALWHTHNRAWRESVAESEANCRISGICFAAHGPHTYEFLADRYAVIMFFMLIFLAGQVSRTKAASLSFEISSLF
jgi:hypothetical protein